MKKELLLFMLCLSVGMTAFSQNKTGIYGLLTAIDHPSKPTQGAILAIMTESQYIPIELSTGEYVPVSTPQMLCGKPIQMDSIYHFVRTETNGVFSYSFEQLYKGASYINAEGYFVSALMGPSAPGGAPLPGVEYYFETKQGEKMRCASFQGESGETGTYWALGGWSKEHTYEKGIDGWGSNNKPDSCYSVRFLVLSPSIYIPTQLLFGTPMSTETFFPREPQIFSDKLTISIQAYEPMKSVAIIEMDGIINIYRANGDTHIDVPKIRFDHPFIMRIEYMKENSTFTQKIYTK